MKETKSSNRQSADDRTAPREDEKQKRERIEQERAEGYIEMLRKNGGSIRFTTMGGK